MREKIFVAAVALMMALGASAQTAASTPFAYPSVPDSITDFNARADYFISHFWDRVDMKRAFSSKEKIARAFHDYLAPMGIASADTVYASVDRFVHRLDKQPKDLLYVAELAERNLYADSAFLPSDELYVRFLTPVVANRKVDKAYKARYEAQLAQLRGSLVGQPMGELRFTGRDGRSVRFFPRQGQAVIIYFNDPDCSDCNMARIRLMANARAKELVESGELAIVALTPGEPDENWRAHADSLPEQWLAGADPDLDMQIDLRAGVPSFYLIDEQGVLRAKALSIDSLLEILSRI